MLAAGSHLGASSHALLHEHHAEWALGRPRGRALAARELTAELGQHDGGDTTGQHTEHMYRTIEA